MGSDDQGNHLPQPRGQNDGPPFRWTDLPAFYESRYPALLRSLMCLGMSLPDAEDALGRAIEYLTLRLRHGGARPIQNPFAYVKKAAIRYYLQSRKAERHETELVYRLVGAGKIVLETDDHGRHAQVEERDLVLELIGRLPERQRTVMALAIDGLTPSEVAAVLGANPATIRANLLQARRQLKPLLPPELAPSDECSGDTRHGRVNATAERREDHDV